MNYETFYTIVLRDNKVCSWLAAWESIYHLELFSFLEEIRAGLLDDMEVGAVTEAVIEQVRAYISAN